MPNWCSGNIRFCGKTDDILRLLKENLKYYTYQYDEKTKRSENVGKDAIVEWDDDNEMIQVCSPWEDSERSWCHINGTRRNFINLFSGPDFFSKATCIRNGRSIIVFDNFSAAWSIDPTPYVEMSKKYNVDIRIMGWERGVGFDQDIIVEKGEITRNACSESKDYWDWIWDTEMPYLGG